MNIHALRLEEFSTSDPTDYRLFDTDRTGADFGSCRHSSHAWPIWAHLTKGKIKYANERRKFPVHSIAQTKFAASSVLPTPLYFAKAGYGHSGRVRI